MMRAAVTALPFLVLQLAKVGAPLNFAPSTSASVARPDRAWVTLNTPPLNLPFCVFVFGFLAFFLAEIVACCTAVIAYSFLHNRAQHLVDDINEISIRTLNFILANRKRFGVNEDEEQAA